MRKTILIAIVVLVAAAALVAAAPGFEKLARLTVWNRTGETINILLTTPKSDGGMHYYLTVKPGLTVYTVERKVYDITYWSCGGKMTGMADVLTQLSLTFTDCAKLHRWTWSLKYRQEVDAAGRNVWYNTAGGAFLFQTGVDAAGHPTLVDANGAVVPWVATVLPKYPLYYVVAPYPNVNNLGEPSIEKIHNTLQRWEWIGDDVRCDTGSVTYDANAAYDVWGWCRVGYHWGTRNYRSPAKTGGIWNPWRLSYDSGTARGIRWYIRTSKSLSNWYH